jgi:phosphoenolpyruvate---glycerone phosphotransferase subunit DhaK
LISSSSSAPRVIVGRHVVDRVERPRQPPRAPVILGRARNVHQTLVATWKGASRRANGEAILLINGFGATPLMELYLMYDGVRKLVERAGVKVARSLVGNYVTSLDMAGCSVTLSMLNQETLELWDAPVATPALRWRM